MRLLTLTSLLTLLTYTRTQNDNYYGGACTQSNNTIYWVGGKSVDNTQEINNESILSIKLRNKLDINKPDSFKPNKTDAIQTIGLQSKAAIYDDKLFVFGGNVDIDKSFWYYDFNSSKANTIKNFPKKDVFGDDGIEKDNSISDFVMQYYEDHIVLMGGKYKDKKQQDKYVKKIILYNIKQGEWELYSTNLTNAGAVSTIYNDKVYMIGGKTDDKEVELGLQTIITFDLRQRIIKVLKSKNDVDKKLVPKDSITINDSMYLFLDGNNTNKIYKLNLKELNYTSHNIEGYEYHEQSCLYKYNNYIINLYGKLNKGSTIKTQMINTNTFQLNNKIMLDSGSTSKPDKNAILGNYNFTEQDHKEKKDDGSPITTAVIVIIFVIPLVIVFLLAIFLTIVFSNPKDTLIINNTSSNNLDKAVVHEDMNDYHKWLNNSKDNIPMSSLNK